MIFAGWTGSTGGLTGNPNPDITTIHDQFVPTANFNVSSTPIAITRLSPSSAISSSNALNITIYGTGFTSNDTYAYWNGSYRPITFVSSTQLTIELSAGDLASVGAQDIVVGNYTPNGSNTNTCGATAETSFTVTTPGAAGPPTGVSVSPSSGTGLTQKFTAVYSDPNGVADLKSIKVLFNTSKVLSNGCAVLYEVAANKLYLYDNAGTAVLPTAVTPGGTASVSNSQCTLAGTGSSFSTSGNDLTLKVALTFTGTFTGKKNVYLQATGKTSSSGYVEKGTWTP